ncbi:MAG: nucleotidyltransferase family protein [Candidatus Omnitrophota bacterium]
MQKKFSDEIKLILSCAKPEPDNHEIEKVHNLLRLPLDWEFILKQATSHNIAPLIYHRLNKLDKNELIPSHIFSRLKESYNTSLTWNLLLVKELHLVSDALNNAGVDIIPIKGVILAEILYSNIALRGTGDIDILIKSENMLAVEKVLSQAGYHKDLTEYSERYYTKYHCHMPYKRTDELGRQFLCEVHWALSFPRPNIVSLANIWKSAKRQIIRDKSMFCLSCEDTFFSLSLHLRRYCDPLSLRYICDISRLVEVYKNTINWDYIITESMNNRLISTAYFALYFAKEMLDAPVPEDVLNRLDPGFIRRKSLQYLIRNKTFSRCLENKRTRQYLYVFLRFLIYDKTKDFLSYIMFIPIEEFARFYKLPFDSKKTMVFYRIRIIYIPFKLFSELLSSSRTSKAPPLT